LSEITLVKMLEMLGGAINFPYKEEVRGSNTLAPYQYQI